MPILRIRDGNGNFQEIPFIKGTDGKTAYEQAVEGGYKGTEEEFNAYLNDVYETSSDLNTELEQGGSKMITCGYNVNTLNTPYKKGLTTFQMGVVYTNAYSEVCSTQICIPTGDYNVFARTLNGNGISEWEKIAGKYEAVAAHDETGGNVVVTGSSLELPVGTVFTDGYAFTGETRMYALKQGTYYVTDGLDIEIEEPCMCFLKITDDELAMTITTICADKVQKLDVFFDQGYTAHMSDGEEMPLNFNALMEKMQDMTYNQLYQLNFTSPNGNCFSISVDDDGKLITTAQ